MAMVMSPCVVADRMDHPWQPCGMLNSRSQKRKLRDRRVAVRRSQKTALEVLDLLRGASAVKESVRRHGWNVAAPEFTPSGDVRVGDVQIDMDSMPFTLEGGDVKLGSQDGELDDEVLHRRTLKEALTADCNIKPTCFNGSVVSVPQRRISRDERTVAGDAV